MALTADHLVDTDLKALADTTAEAQRLLDERDALVMRAFAKGASLRRIADAAGMTHVGVKKLVERRQPDFVVTTPEGNLTVMEAKHHALIAAGNTERVAELLSGMTVVHTIRYDPFIEEAAAE